MVSLGSLESLGVVLAVVAFQPFVQAYHYLPFREISLLVMVAGTFCLFILLALRKATARILGKIALITLAAIEGVAIALLDLSTLGVFLFPPAFLVAVTLIELAMYVPARQGFGRLLSITLLASLVLLGPAIVFLLPLYTTRLYVYLPGALDQALLAAVFSVLYTVTILGVIVGRLRSRPPPSSDLIAPPPTKPV